ncbi:uncharacterized protein RJT20DRAFT_16132 [Scheffersomyces xylosifermentans]|uniref:uncharacterized protein n=1 Tax=Scheffersomyces xylosifermentans TaxID=1304137 RepID=UPI00315C9D1E
MSTISKKVFATFKTLQKNLHKELLIIQNRSNKIHNAKDLEKQQALLQYKKVNLLRENKDVSDINSQIEKLKKGDLQDSTELHSKHIIKHFEEVSASAKDALDEKYKLNNLSNVITFLNSQREYTELLERYNPGLTMKQDDKVKRTAHRVGLEVPE